MQARDLERLGRQELIERAQRLGAEKASVLTRAELVDEIVRRTVSDPIQRRLARGLLGVARDLVARVVERGLHLPNAAALIRDLRPAAPPAPPRPPIATVTLAEIYAGQGHKARALGVLDQVLAREPDHAAARALRDRIAARPDTGPVRPPEPEEAPEPAPEHEATTPAAPADELAAPERHEPDEVVLVPVDPRTVRARCRVRRTMPSGHEGALVLRVVAVAPSWDGPIVRSRDMALDDRTGDRVIRDLPDGAFVRAAVGWRERETFVPLCVGRETVAPLGELGEPEISVSWNEAGRAEAAGAPP